MARPTTKAQLLEAGNLGYEKLIALIETMGISEQEKEFSFEGRDRNIRDVLIHLHEWHKLLLNWIKQNQRGINTNFLLEPYNWKTYPKMNVEFWEKHQTTPLANARQLLQESHSQVMKTVEPFTNEELFTNKYFSWTGSTSLGSYCVSSTSSHYDWAMKIIRKHKRALKNEE